VGRLFRFGAIGLGLLVGALAVLALVGTTLLLTTGTVRMYTAVSPSMTPALECAEPVPDCESDTSDRFAAFTRFRSYDRGDVVVFQTPPPALRRCGVGGKLVQRIVGLPGEKLAIRARGGVAYVHADGVELDEPYLDPERRGSWPAETFTVPDGSFFLMGDNRPQSCDSRVFGAVPEENVVAEVSMVYWPPSRISFR
jgi:signal peptidase I